MAFWNKKEKTLEERAAELGIPLTKTKLNNGYVSVQVISTGYDRDGALHGLNAHRKKHGIVSFYRISEEKVPFDAHRSEIKLTADGYMPRDPPHLNIGN